MDFKVRSDDAWNHFDHENTSTRCAAPICHIHNIIMRTLLL